ncbi:MAG: ribonuclease P protein component [Rickettsiales bacterium]|jgi:ribonuclease P protein component|nr:ribonuclease P protein component [Rickettsiales bacterium]
MVHLIRFKDSPVRLRPLKSRRDDFFRINPRAIARLGAKRLVKRGLLVKGAEAPEDNPNHFISKNVMAHWSPTRFSDGDVHVGFTVTVRTISKRANERNLIRRRLRSAVNENIRNFGIKGFDFVFTAREGLKEASYADMCAELRKIFKYAECRIKENG